ncbi:MAG TPA: hypothetical protein VKJ65_14140 [Phycisphaerae bacterium]|nr:hypothetical protein [Phycisphaerae bacterium]
MHQMYQWPNQLNGFITTWINRHKFDDVALFIILIILVMPSGNTNTQNVILNTLKARQEIRDDFFKQVRAMREYLDISAIIKKFPNIEPYIKNAIEQIET